MPDVTLWRGTAKRTVRRLTAVLCLMLCMAFLAVPVSRADAVCKDLSRQCSYSTTKKKTDLRVLYDDRVSTGIRFKNGSSVTVKWKAGVPAANLYYFAHVLPESFTLTQKNAAGEILREETFTPARACGLIPLEDGCRRIVLTCSKSCTLNSLKIFSAGTGLPKSAIYWKETEETDGCDLMLFSAHYDDEILFMGAVPILYAGRDKRDMQVVYMRGSDGNRRLEAIQGLWYMGVRREPVSLTGTNKSLAAAVKNDGAPGLENDDLGSVVALLRRYKPQVVVTHAVNGEYGHPAHVATSALVRRGVELAADAGYYPESAAAYGTWQVKKLYVHLWKNGQLTLSMGKVKTMGNDKVIRIAEEAMRFHKSQARWSPGSTHAKYKMNRFGLYLTTVGPDTPGVNDMFEHIY